MLVLDLYQALDFSAGVRKLGDFEAHIFALFVDRAHARGLLLLAEH